MKNYVFLFLACACSSSRFSTAVDEHDGGEPDAAATFDSRADAPELDALPDSRDAQAELVEDGPGSHDADAPLDAGAPDTELDAGCVPKACEQLAPGRVSCGMTNDGCGDPIACGDCPINFECLGNLCESTCMNEGPAGCGALGGDLIRCYFGDESKPPNTGCIVGGTGIDPKGPYVAWCCS